MALQQNDLRVTVLGDCRWPSPLQGAKHVTFVGDQERIRYHANVGPHVPAAEADLTFEEAGPRNPSSLTRRSRRPPWSPAAV